MKRIITLTLIFVASVSAANAEYVNGHMRRNGTYVQGHYKTTPNNTVRDNYNYRDNQNLNTGRQGNNYYRNNPSSDYYGTPPQQQRRSKTYGY